MNKKIDINNLNGMIIPGLDEFSLAEFMRASCWDIKDEIDKETAACREDKVDIARNQLCQSWAYVLNHNFYECAYLSLYEGINTINVAKVFIKTFDNLYYKDGNFDYENLAILRDLVINNTALLALNRVIEQMNLTFKKNHNKDLFTKILESNLDIVKRVKAFRLLILAYSLDDNTKANNSQNCIFSDPISCHSDDLKTLSYKARSKGEEFMIDLYSREFSHSIDVKTELQNYESYITSKVL